MLTRPTYMIKSTIHTHWIGLPRDMYNVSF